jgi:hypothetical protein
MTCSISYESHEDGYDAGSRQAEEEGVAPFAGEDIDKEFNAGGRD